MMERENDMQEPLKILLILTGGTIGTVVSGDGIRRIPGPEKTEEPLLLQVLRDRYPGIKTEFTIRTPYQVLSEHMTMGHMEKLAACLREELSPEKQSCYDAVFITHGSDTLAFTAAFLGELMQGCPLPVFLLAAQRPLEDPESNGPENVRAALLLTATIRGAVKQGTARHHAPVYVPYRNSDGIMYLHWAEELRQCEPGTDDFFSSHMGDVREYVGENAGKNAGKNAGEKKAEKTEPWVVPEVTFQNDVLLLHPYVGINYDHISLEHVRAVVHTLYHSSTAPKELVGFLDRCREAGVFCYILPCEPENCHYETTRELILHGAIPVSGMTEERAYIRLMMRKSI